ncbi:hypothetical protein MTR_3g035270 [Medicago truncatula]|uniref:Uncharacterized protein n=1 Tax=Medicago truncatula TaxID=3880 RepID=G7J0Y1_MEDTR|nr:hypothetical protein MTR_3g035270 [Medicago truncatula]
MAEKRALKEYAITFSDEPYDTIVYPTVEDIKFEIKPALIYLVQQNQFDREQEKFYTFGQQTTPPKTLCVCVVQPFSCSCIR